VPSLVRDEFGPTLPELIAGRTGHPVRRVRTAILAAAAIAVVAVLAIKVIQREAAKGAVVLSTEGEFAFNLTYDDDRLERVEPGTAERLRLVSKGDAPVPLSFTVTERKLPAYRGDINGFLPLYATLVVQEMELADPAFVLRGEARARINDNPGYQLVFQTKVDGTTTYGKRVLLYDDLDDDDSTLNRPTVLADVVLLNGRSQAIPNANAVGGNGALKDPYRSFRFGRDRP